MLSNNVCKLAFVPREQDPNYSERLALAMRRAKRLDRKGNPDRAWLAESLSISVQAVGHVITGLNLFSAANNARAARLLVCNAYWLATGEEAPEAVAWPFTAELLPAVQKLDAEGLRRAENQIRSFLDLPLLQPQGPPPPPLRIVQDENNVTKIHPKLRRSRQIKSPLSTPKPDAEPKLEGGE